MRVTEQRAMDVTLLHVSLASEHRSPQGSKLHKALPFIEMSPKSLGNQFSLHVFPEHLPKMSLKGILSGSLKVCPVLESPVDPAQTLKAPAGALEVLACVNASPLSR